MSRFLAAAVFSAVLTAAQPPADYQRLAAVTTDIVTSPDFFDSSLIHLEAQLADVPGVERERGVCAPDLTIPNPDPRASPPYLLSVSVNAPDCQTAPRFQSLNLVIPGHHPDLLAAIKPKLEAAYGPVAETVKHGTATFYRWHPGKRGNLSVLDDPGGEDRPGLISLFAIRLPEP